MARARREGIIMGVMIALFVGPLLITALLWWSVGDGVWWTGGRDDT